MTIAQQLEIDKFPYEIKNPAGDVIYYESAEGDYEIRKFDARGNRILLKNSAGYVCYSWYNEDNKCVRNESSNGYWETWEYDEMSRVTKFNNSFEHWAEWEYDEDGKSTCKGSHQGYVSL
jgi:hypothetical protein